MREARVFTGGNMKRLVRFAITAYALILGICTLSACSLVVFEGAKVPDDRSEIPDVEINSPFTTPGNTLAPSPAASQSPESTDAAWGSSPAPTDEFQPSPCPSPEATLDLNATEVPTCTPAPSFSSVPTDNPIVTDVPETPNNSTVDSRVVYMTFDDGPCQLTYQLLDILDRYNVKATFFTVGYFVDRHPEIVREAESRGHLIACHTYSHDYYSIYESAQTFMDDVHRWEAAVERALGHLPEQVVVRFPGGSRMSSLSAEVREDIFSALEQNGYRWYDWNCGNNDAWPAGNVDNLPIAEYLFNSSMLTLKWAFNSSKPCIFLSHDTNEDTINMIHLVIEELIDQGAVFHTLAECP